MKRETLNSRERVIRTLNHQPVDRMPIDLGAHMSTGISMFAYRNLRHYLGLATDNIRIPDMVQGLAYVDVDVLERFHCDCILLEPGYRDTIAWNPRADYRFTIPAEARPRPTGDGGWMVAKGDASMRMPAGGFFFDGAWLSDWGHGSEADRLALYAREAERIFKETPYAAMMIGYSHGVGVEAYGGGSINDAISAHDDPETLHRRREQRCAESIRRMGTVIDAFGPYIQMVAVGDDMGSQNGPLCSPHYIETFCMPYYKRFCDFVHANSDIKVFLHCCGSIRPVIPLLIEAGIDVLNPVQISAEDMEPRTLKDAFGGRICFWGGGCNTQQVLGKGTPDDVARNVRDLTGIFKPGGGYVFNQVHNIMGDVPPENIVAMLDTAYQESFYTVGSCCVDLD